MQILFAELATLKVDDLFSQSMRVFSYQMSRGLLPSGVAGLLKGTDHGYSTRGARSNFFVSRLDPRSIKSIAPKYWNPLSEDLKQSPSIACFKKRSQLNLLGVYGSFVCSVRGCPSCVPPA